MNNLLNEALSIRRSGSRLSWFLVAAGLFALITTISTVTLFAMTHADMPIWSAALIDPLLSIPLIVSIISDGILSKHGLKPTKLSTFAKWFTGIAALLCNTWSVWGNPAALLIHSIPVFIIVLLAAMVPGMRRRFHDLSSDIEFRGLAQLDAELADAQRPVEPLDHVTGTSGPPRDSVPAQSTTDPVPSGFPRAPIYDDVRLAAVKDKSSPRKMDDLEWATKTLIDLGELPPDPTPYKLQTYFGIGVARSKELKMKVNRYASTSA